jgi:GNAT superfamily N-acetyltransferase
MTSLPVQIDAERLRLQVEQQKPVTVISPFDPQYAKSLARLFSTIAWEAPRFTPHPMSEAQAEHIATYQGPDVYAGAWVGGPLMAYGFLRGWDAGYAVPSLGIYVAPSARGTGLSVKLMRYLHTVAGAKGATQVRLRVCPDTTPARRLYAKCGYTFDGTIERGELVGLKTLHAVRREAA